MIGAVLTSFLSTFLKWIADRISLKGVIFASLLIPFFVFIKGFVISTLHLVSGSFGGSASSLVVGSINAVFGNSALLSSFNQLLTFLDNNQIFSCGWFFRLVAFNEMVSILSWWIDSLVVIWFLRFVWWCFCRVFDIISRALQHV